ncbi:MAG: T9SS type A sorting domain-containing protein [Flavobacteriales bacterium]
MKLNQSRDPMMNAMRISTFLGLLLLASTMHAQTVERDFYVADGIVYSTAASEDGAQLFIGGAFNQVGPPVPHVARMDFSSELPNLDFPRPSGTVRAVEDDGMGGWFIAGEFLLVDTMPRSRIAHIDASGALTSWAPQVGGTVNCMERVGDTLFIGGYFTTVEGQGRLRLAALDVSSGALLPWDPGTNGGVIGLAAEDGALYVCGEFSNVGGQLREYMAACALTTGEVLPWNPLVDGPVLQLRTSNDGIFACGRFLTVNGTDRPYLAKLDAATGDLLPWNAVIPAVGNNRVAAMTIHNGALYFTGVFNSVNGVPHANCAAVDLATALLTPFDPPTGVGSDAEAIAVIGNTVLVGRLSDQPLVAFDATSGAVSDWAPNAIDGRVYAIAGTPDNFLVAGEFLSIGGEDRDGFAALDGATGALLPQFPTPSSNAPIKSLLVVGDTLFVGGRFSSLGGATRRNIAAIHIPTATVLDWGVPLGASNQEVSSMAVEGDVLYSVGTFATADGQPRGLGAALSVSTGDLLPWDPASGSAISTVAAQDGIVYVGGGFTSIGGQARQRFAALDAVTALATPLDVPAQSAVWDVELDGNTLYLGGNFTSLGGQPRSKLGAIDLATGQVTGWAPQATGTSQVSSPGTEVWGLAVRNGLVHIGGNFSSIAGEPRRAYAVVDAVTGEATMTTVRFGSNAYVRSITPRADLVLICGGFTEVELEVRIGSFALADCDLMAYYADGDGDGYGDPATAVVQCTPGPEGFVANANDCNDGDELIWTGGACITDSGGDGTWSADCICIGTAGVGDDNHLPQLLLFPNPFTDMLTIRTSFSGPLRITLSDLTGRVVFKEQKNLSEGADLHLPLNGLAQGNYVVRIDTDQGRAVQQVMKK